MRSTSWRSCWRASTNPPTPTLEARWLFNIAVMTFGRWPDELSQGLVISPAALRSAEPFPRFVKIAPQLGLNTFSLSGGTIAGDFDGDKILT